MSEHKQEPPERQVYMRPEEEPDASEIEGHRWAWGPERAMSADRASRDEGAPDEPEVEGHRWAYGPERGMSARRPS